MNLDVLADVLKRRGVAKVYYFHADHFEPWGGGISETSARAVDRFAQQTRNSPFASKLSLFYSTSVPAGLDGGQTDPVEGRRVAGDRVTFYPRPPRLDEMVKNVIRPLIADGQHEMHLHVHHEWWTRNDSHFDSPVSHWVNAHSTAELDQQRLDLFFALATSLIAHETGTPFSRWGFVHGNWALAGSDRRICQIQNELSMIMRHGGFGDFSFPAGRSNCDPAIEVPFTCLPLDTDRAYDRPAADPLPIGRDTRVMRPERFFIWNSKIKANYSSLDYYYEPNRDRFKQTETMVDNWLKDSVVIGDCLFVKTHAHSMYGYYKMGEADSLIPHCYPDIVAIFECLSKTCDRAGVELQCVTVNEVMNLLQAVDGARAEPVDIAATIRADGGTAAETIRVSQTEVSDPPALPRAAAAPAQEVEPTKSPEQAIAAVLRDWMQADKARSESMRSVLGSLLDDNQLVSDGARAILEYVKKEFAPGQTRIVHVAKGNTPLAVLLAVAGYEIVVYEPDPIGIEAFNVVITSLGRHLPSLRENLRLVRDRYSDAFAVSMVSGAQRSLLLAIEEADTSTPVTSRARILRSAAIFDDAIVGTADRAGSPEAVGEAPLPALFAGVYRPIAAVWSNAATEIWHLRPARVFHDDAPSIVAPHPPMTARADKRSERTGHPLQLDLSTFDAELVAMQRDWMAGEGRNFRADDSYAMKLDRNAILEAHERALGAAIAEIYDTESTNIVEIGSGCGALALLLARHGFTVCSFEGERRRHPVCQSHLANQSRLHSGLEQRLSFVEGFFPEAFSLRLHRSERRSVCLATNITHSYTAKNQDLVLRTAAIFDEIILDLGRFGVNRDTHEERDRLLQALLNSYYEPVEQVYQRGAYEYWRLRVRHRDQPPIATQAVASGKAPRRAAARPRSRTSRKADLAEPTSGVASTTAPGGSAALLADFPLRSKEAVLFTIYGDEKVPACPVCKSTGAIGLWRIPMARLDTPISISGGSVSQLPTRQVPSAIFCYDFCQVCQTIFMNPVPRSAKEHYRNDDHYISKMANPTEWRGYEEVYERFAPAIPADAKVMLDAACSVGQYLQIAQRRSPQRWQRLIGLDLSKGYVDHMREHGIEGHVLDLECDDLATVTPTDSVDFVTFCEAFEHMGNALDVLRKLLALVRPGGRLFFTAQRYGKEAKGPVRPGEHIYISENVLNELPERLGCQVLDVGMTNMRYYVTLEKLRSLI